MTSFTDCIYSYEQMLVVYFTVLKKLALIRCASNTWSLISHLCKASDLSDGQSLSEGEESFGPTMPAEEFGKALES